MGLSVHDEPAGAPVLPENEQLARAILRLVAVPLEARRLEKLDRISSSQLVAVTSWQGHEEMVQLAIDYSNAREAEGRIEVTRARVREIKRQLRERGEEVSDREGDEEEDEAEQQEDGNGRTIEANDDEDDDGGNDDDFPYYADADDEEDEDDNEDEDEEDEDYEDDDGGLGDDDDGGGFFYQPDFLLCDLRSDSSDFDT